MNKEMFITREFIRLNPHILFVFGDNDMRNGFGGMAKEFRDEPNSIGIRVKKAPNMSDSAFYTDDEFGDNIEKIDEDIDNIKLRMKTDTYTTLYIPEGIGEGFAKLKEKARFTHLHLKQQLDILKEG